MAVEKQVYNFDAVIPWHILKQYLSGLSRRNQKNLVHANGESDMLRAQGEGSLLEKLMNLPEALKMEYEPSKE